MANFEEMKPRIHRSDKRDALPAEVDALNMQDGTAAELAALLPGILNKAFKGEL